MKHNVVHLIGYVGGSPKISITNTGKKKAYIRVGTHDLVFHNDKKTEYNTVWHDVIAWDRLAEIAEISFVKGSKIRVEGSLLYRNYDDSFGKKRYITEIIVAGIENLDR